MAKWKHPHRLAKQYGDFWQCQAKNCGYALHCIQQDSLIGKTLFCNHCGLLFEVTKNTLRNNRELICFRCTAIPQGE